MRSVRAPKMDQRENPGRWLLDARNAAGLRLADLASAMDVSVATITNWQCGHHAPQLSHVQPLSEILGVSIHDVLWFVYQVAIHAERKRRAA